MEKELVDFIQENSPDGGFLQSEHWRKFQESVGRKTFTISVGDDNGELIASANIIRHKLPIVGDYFYVPRGPVVGNTKHVTYNSQIKKFLNDLFELARKNKIGWIRIEPASEEILQAIKENLPGNIKIKKSSVDMQPREILVLDISKSEEDILAGMKQKTRYNIRLAEKRGVCISHNMEHARPHDSRQRVGRGTWNREHVEEFLKLVKITAKRDKITSHSESYYRQMFEIIPPEILKLYVAEYEGKIIAANLVLFFGRAATYMHGASDDEHRSVMAPYLLQWQQILDAKKAGCLQYDFGGIKTLGENNWAGITKFKMGFAPDVEPIQFPGSYDIILKPGRYKLYRALQKIKRLTSL